MHESGRVVDAAGRPLPGVEVVADLGPDLVIEMRVEKYMLFPRRYFVAPGAKAFRIHPGKN